MIKMEYKGNRIVSDFNENFTIEVDDEQVLSTVFYCFLKVCLAAGYSIKSFDNLIKDMSLEIDDDYNSLDCLSDVLYS